MSGMIRLYCESRFHVEDLVQLQKDEWHYFKNVRRAQGDIILFNSFGQEAEVELEHDSFRVKKILETTFSPWQVRLCVGLPDRQVCRDLVFLLSELGIEELSFFPAKRSQSARQRFDSISKLERWSIESARQCARGRPLKISSISWDQILDFSASSTFVLDESNEGEAPSFFSGALESCQIVIGPEGGWSEEEREAFRSQKFKRVHFPTPILKVATAATIGAFWAIQGLSRNPASSNSSLKV
jgi:RsmE family RNA methyltransferase